MIIKKFDKDTVEFVVATSCLKQPIEGDINRVIVRDVDSLTQCGVNGIVQR